MEKIITYKDLEILVGENDYSLRVMTVYTDDGKLYASNGTLLEIIETTNLYGWGKLSGEAVELSTGSKRKVIARLADVQNILKGE